MSPGLNTSPVPDAIALLGGEPVIKYFKLAPIYGRGGTIGILLSAAGARFRYDRVPPSEWPAVKAQVSAPGGDNPLGHIPITYLNGNVLTDSHATCRYLARLLGWYGQDPARDYKADALDNAIEEWRAAWSSAAFGDNATKATYKSTRRTSFYSAVETFLSRYGSDGATAIAPTSLSYSLTYVDAQLFGLTHDDVTTFGEDLLKSGDYPRLKTFYDAYGALPAVTQWVKDNEAAATAAAL